MIRSNLLVCLFGISACSIACSVAREAIIGGQRAIANQFKYQVSLQNHSKHFCGGAIMNKEFIITSANCVVGRNGRMSYQSITVLIGTSDLRITSEPALTRYVRKFYTPADFSPARTAHASTGDIALLELNQALPLIHQRSLATLQMPISKSHTYESDTAVISGFGWTWINVSNGMLLGGGMNDTRLRSAETKVLAWSDPACYSNMTINIDKKICARIEQSAHQNNGVCHGDSGGPLVHDGAVIIGVLSTTSMMCTEARYGAIYTRISEYLTFIRKVKGHKMTKNMREYVLPYQSFAGPSRAIIA